MSRWLVTQGSNQFSVNDLAELKTLAQQGRVGAGDMIQPPGATDWLYVVELPELAQVVRRTGEDPYASSKGGINSAMVIPLLLVGIVGAGGAFYHFYNAAPRAEDLQLLGNSKGLQLTEMLVTAPSVTIRDNPADSANGNTSVAKDEKLHLEAKRGDFYRVKTEGGAEGWVKVNEVVPAYFFASGDVRQNYDPIYNPDQYVFVKNGSWAQAASQMKENKTVFTFLVSNESKFEMTGLKLQAVIKDDKGKELEKIEIPIDGVLAPQAEDMVGMLLPDPKAKGELPRMMTAHSFDEMAKADPDLQLRWTAGIEVQHETKEFSEAKIDLLEVRAIPKSME